MLDDKIEKAVKPLKDELSRWRWGVISLLIGMVLTLVGVVWNNVQGNQRAAQLDTMLHVEQGRK